MSKTAQKLVAFYDYDDNYIETVTDAETKKHIDDYKSVYNQISSFKIAPVSIRPSRVGFTCDAIQAQSTNMRILCLRMNVKLL